MSFREQSVNIKSTTKHYEPAEENTALISCDKISRVVKLLTVNSNSIENKIKKQIDSITQ